VELAQKKFRAGDYVAAGAISRLIRKRAPDEKEPQRLLSLVAAWLPLEEPLQNSREEYYLALAEAHLLLGEADLAMASYKAALAIDPDFVPERIKLLFRGFGPKLQREEAAKLQSMNRKAAARLQHKRKSKGF
jgi:tetratricopeptide (TPR) repeat protein